MIAFEKSVGAVVFRREADNQIKYLILQYRKGHWEFPRGHKERGETDEQTARREIQEETGIRELRIIPKFAENNYFWYIAKGKEKKERRAAGQGILIFKKAKFFLAETKTAETRLSSEQLAFTWLPVAEALERVTYESAKKVLARADQFLQNI